MTQPNECQPINIIREEGISTHFSQNISKRVLILTEAFPFMFIGEIISVVDDFIEMKVQITSIPALEGKIWFVHIDSIEVFYIETENGVPIPELKE
ncbi:hypothetical protein CSV80_16420 [Sporosarcina sp. P12(2017)]|uniref:hypothetical protein n=1 Tax=unclassified Sporosarcina TaxID=2647733 RepID=UPI000C16B492|nr:MULTISPECIES: hypothetical protein [unclassified Sporosarcina]PIC56028.1 hypothetical protein CSV81_16425 [Sporosarcina sp. P10]PIC59355.1 hypothetical protein CSV80_16420 [Sporosarcina sp. P12(2017)]